MNIPTANSLLSRAFLLSLLMRDLLCDVYENQTAICIYNCVSLEICSAVHQFFEYFINV